MDAREKSLAQLACGAVLVAAILALFWRQPFDLDEFEGLHTAWKLLQGERIYADFFQHHHPLLYYLLVPLHLLLGETTAILFAARLMMLAFLCGSIWLAWRLARDLYGPRVAVLTALMIPLMSTSFTAAIETRPDVPQMFFGMLCVVLLYRHFRMPSATCLALSGLALGVSVLFLQKALFLAAGLGIVLALRLKQRRFTLREGLIFAAAAACAPLAYLGYLASHGELSTYFLFNYRFNAGIGHEDHHVDELFSRIAGFSPVALLCLLHVLFNVRKTAEQREIVIIAAVLVAMTLLAGLHFRQYYLMLTPFAAMAAAHGFVELFSHDRRIAGLALAALAIPALAAYGYQVRRGNAAQIELAEYVRQQAPPGSYVHDVTVRFNLFRKDLDYFWFRATPGEAIERYRKFRPYAYDPLVLIDRLKPAVIATDGLPTLDDPRIADHYRKTAYRGVLVRVPKP
jgi:4-amino-4-deoxy-L-arabinose transferase-like glycosyltransferase